MAVGRSRRRSRRRRSRRRSRTKTPVSLIDATKAPPAPKTQKHHAQRTPSGGATRVTQDRRRDDTPPIASRVRPQDDDSTTPGGGIGPLRRHPAPGDSSSSSSERSRAGRCDLRGSSDSKLQRAPASSPPEALRALNCNASAGTLTSSSDPRNRERWRSGRSDLRGDAADDEISGDEGDPSLARAAEGLCDGPSACARPMLASSSSRSARSMPVRFAVTRQP